MKSKGKRTWGEDNAHPNVRLKVINSETKRLTRHDIIDRIAEQAALVIVLVSNELRIHLNNLQRPRFSFA